MARTPKLSSPKSDIKPPEDTIHSTETEDAQVTESDGRVLPPDFALQVPGDYIASLKEVVPAAIRAAAIDPSGLKPWRLLGGEQLRP